MPALWEPDTPASGRITEPRLQQLHIYSAGWSPSTPASGIKGHVVYLANVSTPAALDADKDRIPGNIVLLDTASYGEHTALGAIVQSWDRIQQLKPLAILITGSANGSQNAEALTFTGTLSTVPVAQVGREDVLLIKRLLEHGPVSVEFSFTNKVRPATQVQNVVADLAGREPAGSPDSIVIVGGHLDSWHPATGAQDNGTGVATVLDVARSIQAIGHPPRRTVRFLLFGGEEQGLVGSVAYTKAHTADMPSYDAVLISDTGGEPAKGWYLMGREDERGALSNIEPILAGLGGNTTTSNTQFLFETDHAGFDVQGVPSLVLWTGVEKYFRLHHQASDSFDSVVQPDLTQGVAVTAATAYAIADAPEPFAPHLNRAQVVDMLKAAKQYDDYEVFKAAGMFP